jgi:hypothetical protein
LKEKAIKLRFIHQAKNSSPLIEPKFFTGITRARNLFL